MNGTKQLRQRPKTKIPPKASLRNDQDKKVLLMNQRQLIVGLGCLIKRKTERHQRYEKDLTILRLCVCTDGLTIYAAKANASTFRIYLHNNQARISRCRLAKQ